MSLAGFKSRWFACVPASRELSSAFSSLKIPFRDWVTKYYALNCPSGYQRRGLPVIPIHPPVPLVTRSWEHGCLTDMKQELQPFTQQTSATLKSINPEAKIYICKMKSTKMILGCLNMPPFLFSLAYIVLHVILMTPSYIHVSLHHGLY